MRRENVAILPLTEERAQQREDTRKRKKLPSKRAIPFQNATQRAGPYAFASFFPLQASRASFSLEVSLALSTNTTGLDFVGPRRQEHLMRPAFTPPCGYTRKPPLKSRLTSL